MPATNNLSIICEEFIRGPERMESSDFVEEEDSEDIKWSTDPETSEIPFTSIKTREGATAEARRKHFQSPFTPSRANMDISGAPLSQKMFTLPSKPVENGPCPVIRSSKSLQARFGKELETVLELLSAILFGFWGILVGILMTFIPRRFRYKNVTGQIVLITGAGSGIGKLMAKKFALKHGAVVVAWDINQSGKDSKRLILSFMLLFQQLEA